MFTFEAIGLPEAFSAIYVLLENVPALCEVDCLAGGERTPDCKTAQSAQAWFRDTFSLDLDEFALKNRLSLAHALDSIVIGGIAHRRLYFDACGLMSMENQKTSNTATKPIGYRCRFALSGCQGFRVN
jgi:hypothetical protein